MSAADLTRFCVHTMTTSPLGLAEAVAAYRAAGVSGITVWRNAVAACGVKEAARILGGSGLKVASLCRGGMFVAVEAGDRQKAMDENRRVIDEAAAIGAPVIVMVCGAAKGVALLEARKQIVEGLGALVPYAEAAGVRLGIEPLHPVYAAERSAVNTLGQANEMMEGLGSAAVGVVIDVYHLWWDERLEVEIMRAGRNKSILAYHVSDWRVPRDVLLDRAVMGEGCIPLREIRGWVERAGFEGMIEVEIFSTELWKMDQGEFLGKIRAAYEKYV